MISQEQVSENRSYSLFIDGWAEIIKKFRTRGSNPAHQGESLVS